VLFLPKHHRLALSTAASQFRLRRRPGVLIGNLGPSLSSEWPPSAAASFSKIIQISCNPVARIPKYPARTLGTRRHRRVVRTTSTKRKHQLESGIPKKLTTTKEKHHEPYKTKTHNLIAPQHHEYRAQYQNSDPLDPCPRHALCALQLRRAT